MKTNYSYYNSTKSEERINEILDASNDSFEEVSEIPSRDKLTFTNGFPVCHNG